MWNQSNLLSNFEIKEIESYFIICNHRKLMLAKINWTFFVKEKHFEDSMNNLVTMLKQELKANVPLPSARQYDDDDDDDEIDLSQPHVVQHAPADLFG